jgi:pimeloyl-ACP methyl ester carboxylesterase
MIGDYDPRLSIHGAGEPIVLVPGLDGTGLLFYRQIPLLARTFRVTSYALRETATTMEELVADLRDVVDAVAGAGERAIVIGESFGGALAMSFALALPDRLAGLIVLNSFPHFAPRIRLHAAIAGLHVIPWGAMGLIRRLTASRLHSRHTHRREKERFMQLTATASRDGYVNRLRILTAYDIRDRLSDLRAPTLFLAADQDHLVPALDQARYMAARVPSSMVQVLSGHGHICLISPDLDLERIVTEWSGAARPAR